MVANWNKALILSEELDLKPTDYHMISTDDTQYEKDNEVSGTWTLRLPLCRVTMTKWITRCPTAHDLSYKPKQEGYDNMHDAENRKDMRMAQANRIRRYIGLKRP